MRKETANRNVTNAAGSRVPFPPPLAYFAGLGLGFGIHQFWPLHIVQASSGIRGVQILGLTLVTIALVVVVFATRAFRHARTTHTFGRPSTSLIVRGPFRFTRNPLYLSGALFHGGVAVFANAVWPLLFLVPALAVVDGLIRREEQYLAERFEKEFEAYRGRVRRWL